MVLYCFVSICSGGGVGSVQNYVVQFFKGLVKQKQLQGPDVLKWYPRWPTKAPWGSKNHATKQDAGRKIDKKKLQSLHMMSIQCFFSVPYSSVCVWVNNKSEKSRGSFWNQMFKAPGETKLKVFSSTLTKRTPAKVDGDSPSTTAVQGVGASNWWRNHQLGMGWYCGYLGIWWDMNLDCRSWWTTNWS